MRHIIEPHMPRIPAAVSAAATPHASTKVMTERFIAQMDLQARVV